MLCLKKHDIFRYFNLVSEMFHSPVIVDNLFYNFSLKFLGQTSVIYFENVFSGLKTRQKQRVGGKK